MIPPRLFHRTVKPAALVVLALLLTACSDLTDPADRPLVQRARLVVTNATGSTTYAVTAAGGNSPSPLVLTSGANQLHVSWLDASGGTVATNGYGLAVTRLSSGIVFSSTSLTSGVLQVSGGARSGLGELRLRDSATGDDAFAADLDFEVR